MRRLPRLRCVQGFATLALCGLLSSAQADTFTRAALPADHPLVGSWNLVFPPSGTCHEQYQFSADGTRQAQSGQELISSDYSLEETIVGKLHFYKWTDKVVSSNNRPDCSGSVTPVGDVATWYIYLELTTGEMSLCKTPDLRDTYAIFHRMKAGGI